MSDQGHVLAATDHGLRAGDPPNAQSCTRMPIPSVGVTEKQEGGVGDSPAVILAPNQSVMLQGIEYGPVSDGTRSKEESGQLEIEVVECGIFPGASLELRAGSDGSRSGGGAAATPAHDLVNSHWNGLRAY